MHELFVAMELIVRLEFLVARVTNVRIFALVDLLYVKLEIQGSTEGSITHFANVRLLVHVQKHVSIEGELRREGFTAYFARGLLLC